MAPYRILITSDIHCTDLEDWYGVSDDSRMEHWLRSVWLEHERQPFDLILIPGDISLDYHECKTPFDKGYSTGYVFMKMYASRLPAGVPVLVGAGNHEQFPEETWQKITGNPRQCHAVVGSHTFILLDGFRDELGKHFHSDDRYTPMDVAYIRATMCGCWRTGLRWERKARSSAGWLPGNPGFGDCSWVTAMSIS